SSWSCFCSLAIMRAIFWFSASRSLAARRSVTTSSMSSIVIRQAQPARFESTRGQLFLRKLRAQIDLAQQWWAELYAPQRLAPFDEERKLTQRQLESATRRTLPRSNEASLLETLGKQAQARPVEVQHLGPLAIPTHEEKHVPLEHVPTKLLLDKRCERVEALAHVARLGVRENLHTPRHPDHASLLQSSATSLRVTPSNTVPHGPSSRNLLSGSAASSARICTGCSVDPRRERQ